MQVDQDNSAQFIGNANVAKKENKGNSAHSNIPGSSKMIDRTS